jgi:asparagine synthase (glutamine-hydrolysing)
MCGIAGSVNFSLDIHRLTADLFHRGPDAQNTFRKNNLCLHHHRLSILDIAGGNQPMQLGPLTIIFNGEIYNHNEVRLKYGFQGNTSSDTETILLSYRQSGPACLNDFDGMFALVIFDEERNSLFIARDRAGKKPLYYYSFQHQFVFASELNALQNQVKDSIHTGNIAAYLRFGALHRSSTPYNHISELPPGHYATVDLNSAQIGIKKWWDIQPFYETGISLSESEAREKIDHVLHTAVKRRLESSDLEVGCFLSGGIDSGLVTAVAAGYKPSLKTFTVSFPGAYNEAPLARLVSDKYSTDHTELSISFDALQQDVEKILANYGEPFYDDSAIPSYYVSREAKKYLTVILNGDGADELFGGYRRYVPFSRYDFFNKNGLVTGLAGLLKKIIPFSHEKKSRLNYLYRLADLASQKGDDSYFSASTDIFTGFSQYLVQEPFSAGDDIHVLLERIYGLKQLSGLQKIMLADFNSILPDILLVKMDIATMANSLEGRSPFLSKEMLELAPALPDAFKVKGATTKYLLRKLAASYLPAELINQPKRGFEVPLKQWVDNELKTIIFDYLDSPGSYANNFVEPLFIQKLLNRKVHVSDEKRAKMLYTLFALNVWYKKCANP